jgi:hypothetical protein
MHRALALDRRQQRLQGAHLIQNTLQQYTCKSRRRRMCVGGKRWTQITLQAGAGAKSAPGPLAILPRAWSRQPHDPTSRGVKDRTNTMYRRSNLQPSNSSGRWMYLRMRESIAEAKHKQCTRNGATSHPRTAPRHAGVWWGGRREGASKASTALVHQGACVTGQLPSRADALAGDPGPCLLSLQGAREGAGDQAILRPGPVCLHGCACQ